jgi:type I restriction enzyme S subunit
VDKKVKDNEIPIILCNYLDVYENQRITNEISFMEATASSNEIKKYSLNKNDILITKDSETREDIANPAIVWQDIDNLVCGYHLTIIRPHENKVNGLFLSYRLGFGNVHRYFVSYANGVTRFGLTLPIIRGTKIPLPSLSEQQEIAEILSTWDRAIEQTQKLIDAKRRLKKGLMQQLLTGRMRFPGFGPPVEKAGELPEGWSIKRVDQIGEVITGGTPPKSDEKNYGHFLSWITAMDMGKKYLYDSEVKLSEKGVKKTKTAPKGAVLVTCIASIGLNGIIMEEMGFNQQINAVVVNDDNNNEYFYYLIEFFKHRILRLAGTTALPIINKTNFQSLALPVPSLKEQKEIAEFLCTWDRTIEQTQQLIDAKRRSKKGLMQKLLTGEVSTLCITSK